ncbi:MAG TPA: methyltransferase domain-containing protein [Bryobacteraceae bacterium]
MSEFTGERVIPGQVDQDLWAEHIARYAFAARFAKGKRVLDAGCGTGYGAENLARAGARVVAVDIAAAWPAASGQGPAYCRASYCQASVEAMPFRDASFDLVAAFEVIEHLRDWRAFLLEARRVLAPHGLLLVSTPNRVYYAESRELEGPNPYHVHEFDFEEFQAELCAVFPAVEVLLQNRVEAFAFGGATQGSEAEGAEAQGNDAHFFIGVCGGNALPDERAFVFVPRAANLLRERERHIRKLEVELSQTKAWLDQQIAEHAQLQALHGELEDHLEEKNRWALELEGNWRAAQERIVELQEALRAEQAGAEEMARGYERQVAELEKENRAKTEWAIETETRLTAELKARVEQHAETVQLLDRAEAVVIERTQWAQKLDEELGQAKTQLGMARESRWVKLGRMLGLGPKL